MTALDVVELGGGVLVRLAPDTDLDDALIAAAEHQRVRWYQDEPTRVPVAPWESCEPFVGYARATPCGPACGDHSCHYREDPAGPRAGAFLVLAWWG